MIKIYTTEDFAEILAGEISNKLKPSLHPQLRNAWEAGFQLAMDYGDNAVHFCGEQKENQWKKFLETLNHE